MKTSIVARRLRKSADSDLAIDKDKMETVVCNDCGQRFAIRRESTDRDEKLIEKQSAWVQERLVWDHIQERRHAGTMELPDLL